MCNEIATCPRKMALSDWVRNRSIRRVRTFGNTDKNTKRATAILVWVRSSAEDCRFKITCLAQNLQLVRHRNADSYIFLIRSAIVLRAMVLQSTAIWSAKICRCCRRCTTSARLTLCGTYHFCAGLWLKLSPFKSWRSARVFWPSFLEWPLRMISVSSIKSTDEPRRVSSLFRASTRCYYFTVHCFLNTGLFRAR